MDGIVYLMYNIVDDKGGAGDGEGKPRKEMEQCMQVYEDDGMVRWCKPVLVAVQQLGLDVNKVKKVS